MKKLTDLTAGWRPGVFLGASLLALFACSSVPRSVAAPEVQLVSLSLLESTADGQRFRVSLLLDNPNDVALPIRSVRFNARLGGEGILSGESLAPLELPARGRETLRLEVQTDLVSSVSRLLAVVQGPDDGLAYELNGRLMLAGRPERALPFSTCGTVPLTATMGGAR
jgi:LEA14-like dessication related protein